ncbi:MAG: FliA/WhiG family RNA polymerase sigma factor [Acidobacteriota bacterium]|nr:FliA/WhiG family RNA polymerase sigma factor [Acidobacteriota bacterium]
MNAATKTALTDKQAQQDNAQRDQLILEHLHLVNAIASHVQRSLGVHTELDDLVHAGTMGLFDAATKYQEEKEVSFPIYAKHRIRGAILDSLRQLDWASRDARRQYKQMEAVTRELTIKLNRTPSHAEIADAMGIDARRWQTLMIDFRSFGLAAVRQRSTDREDVPVREVPSSPAQCPDQVFARSEMRHKLSSAMQNLPQRYQQVVKLYYEADMSMKEIGSMLGVNESRVSQIHKSALAKMQIVLSGSGVSSTAAFC